MTLPTDPSPKEFGEALRAARERKAISLDLLADRTKISKRVLEAFETGEFGKLPGGVFPRLFLKQILELIGEDQEPWLRAFDAASGRHSERENRPPSMPAVPASGYRSGPWVIGLLLVAAALAGVFLAQRRDGVTESRATPTPERVLGAVAPTAPAVEVANAPEEPTPEPTEPAGGSQGEPDLAVSPTPGATAVEATPAAPPSPDDLVLTASRDCWVEVAIAGQPAGARLMRAGEVWRVAAGGRRVEILAGDAGALQVSYLGEVWQGIGADGAVARLRVPGTRPTPIAGP